MPSKFNLKNDDLGGFIVGVIIYFGVTVVTSTAFICQRREMFPQRFFKDGCLSAMVVLICCLVGLLWPVLFVAGIFLFGIPCIARLLSSAFSSSVSNIKSHETCCGVSMAGRRVEQQPPEENNGAPDQILDQPPQRETMLCQKVEGDITEAHTSG